jgi:hypothetical protein
MRVAARLSRTDRDGALAALLNPDLSLSAQVEKKLGFG